jgi:hypothetical protein
MHRIALIFGGLRHVVGVTHDRVEIFTKSPKDLAKPPYV